MVRAVGFVALLLAAGPAGAKELPGVTARAPARLSDAALTLALPEHTCGPALAPAPWHDASDARFFATSPTARLDDQELASATLASLVDLRFARGALRLFVFGSPVRPGLTFSRAGWVARWPFC
jgi:hypothetical protein